MSDSAESSTLRRRSLIAVNLLLLVGIAVVARAVAIPAMHAARVRADTEVVSNEARKLYRAFEQYYQRNRGFPNAYAEPAFDPANLDPLRRRGYYRGRISVMLLEGRIDGYDSPDDKGLNEEFWLEMTLARDPSVRFLIAHSDDAPLADGKWANGAFLFRSGSLEPL